ncbi:MAG: hypothetical protein KAH34_19225, partial [Ketobacter sp.]|nr:hypothetical protein [Ketobacter sp.]
VPTVIGMTFFKDLYMTVGALAGVNAAGLEIKEERERAREIIKEIPHPELIKIANNGKDPFENEKPPKHPLHMNTVIMGALVGAAVAGIFILGAEFAVGHAVASLTTSAIIGAGALGGATYGIDRYYLRKVFNFFNKIYDGPDVYEAKQAEIAEQKEHAAAKQPSIEPEKESRGSFTEKLTSARQARYQDAVHAERAQDNPNELLLR